MAARLSAGGPLPLRLLDPSRVEIQCFDAVLLVVRSRTTLAPTPRPSIRSNIIYRHRFAALVALRHPDVLSMKTLSSLNEVFLGRAVAIRYTVCSDYSECIRTINCTMSSLNKIFYGRSIRVLSAPFHWGLHVVARRLKILSSPLFQVGA